MSSVTQMRSSLMKTLSFCSTILSRNFKRGTTPYKAILILTWKCQAHCRMCNIWQRKSSDELTLEEWSTFFQRNTYLKWLTLSGGEPFLRSDLAQVAEAAHRHCPNLYCINTPTNSLATERVLETAEAILQLGIPSYVLSVSLDGPRDVHNQVRGVPDAWEKAMYVLEGAVRLRETYGSRFTVIVEHTLMPDSFGRFDEMVNAVRERVPRIRSADFLVATLNASAHYYGNMAASGAAKPDSAALRKAIQQILAVRRRDRAPTPQFLISQMYLMCALQYVETLSPPMRCRASRSTVFVDPVGVVYACNAWAKVLGGLREHDYSLEKILARLDISALRKDIDDFVCGGCWTPCEATLSLAESCFSPRTIGLGLRALVGARSPAAEYSDER